MTTVPFYFKSANRFFPHIVFVGVGIGTANYIINGDLNWIQWILQSVSTSFLIGYTLLIIGLNKPWFKCYFKTKGKLYTFIFIAFFLIGVLATEVEHIIRSLIFHSQQFQPISAGKMYLFNGIISLVLGYSFFQNNFTNKENLKLTKNKEKVQSEINHTNKLSSDPDSITSIPVKQGENILLIPIKDIAYFEAFDNYSFVYTITREKKLCDYSLLFLEKRLDKNFSRVHRKYIVNENYIKQIKPHINGRYLIEFSIGLDPISSSKGYASIIRKLIKIE